MPTDHLTKAPGEFSADDIRPGMASFLGTGPSGKTCGDCGHRGYYRQTQTSKRDYPDDNGLRTIKVGTCAKYHELTSKHGPVVRKAWQACKYFVKLKEPPI